MKRGVSIKKWLITGRPGVGKTTLITKIAAYFEGFKVGGFFTSEIRESGRRVGFSINTFSGISGILAHVSYNGEIKVGKYKVNLPQFEQVAIPALQDAIENADVILIDEIGKMELFSSRFCEIILTIFDSPKPVVATIMVHSHPFADRLKARTDVTLIEVNLANRDSLAERLVTDILMVM